MQRKVDGNKKVQYLVKTISIVSLNLVQKGLQLNPLESFVVNNLYLAKAVELFFFLNR